MNEETIVAVFETAAHADTAVRDLEAAGTLASAISRHPAATGTSPTGTAAGTREKGFWSNLFGGEPDHDTMVYDRSVESGSHLLMVKVAEDHAASVIAILERSNPIDIDERAASYGLTATGGMAGQPATMRTEPGTPGTMASGLRDTGIAGGEERLQLAEEQLQVGKRLLDRGTTRIRRFVVETPVEENVTLHSEHVSVERRPATGDAVMGDAAFTDKTIEVTESDEEAVVGKTTRVKEEVVVRKEVADRVEAIHDTVRHEDVEITKGDTGVAETTVPPVRR